MVRFDKILVLGGTQMIGRDFIEYYLENNSPNNITIANRGITNNNLFNNIEKIIIDRSQENGCQNLHLEYFDIVLDFSCYNVNDLSRVLKHIRYGRYIVLSSLCSVDEYVLSNQDHWLHNYCLGKKQLEDYILANHIKDFTIVRPCVLYGKHDYTNRFYERQNKIYWKHNDTEVLEDRYHISVRKFTQYLFSCLNTTDSIINIDRDGITMISSAKYTVHPYESKFMEIERCITPYKHIIIDNFLNKETYDKLCNKFTQFIARTKPYKDQPNATSDYEGYISGLGLSDLTDGYEFLASKDLQAFVEKEFDIKTNKFISPSAHFHKAPSKNGFTHRDYNVCSFYDNNPNSDNFITTGGAQYTDDTKYNTNSTKVIRSIALLYYLNNDDSMSCKGGGTGIYDGYNGNLIKTIEPKNNRLFIFEMKHNSYHSFIGANFDRSAVVSWFHSSPAYMINRHWKYFRKYPNLIERWTQKNLDEYWSIENDTEYARYFNRPLRNMI